MYSIEIAEVTPIVSSSEVRDVSVPSSDGVDILVGDKVDGGKNWRKRGMARIVYAMWIASMLFLAAHLLSPITVTRDGVMHAVLALMLVFIFLSVVGSIVDLWYSRLRGGPFLRTVFQCACRCTAYAFVAFVMFFVVLWIIRATNKVHLDDIHPLLPCDIQSTLVAREQPVTLWIIPIQEGQGISEFPQWCKDMKALEDSGQARLGLHGVRHLINPYEFECTSEHCFENYTEAFQEGVTEWKRAFNYTPHLFAAPGGFASEDAVDVARSNIFQFNVRTIINGLFQRIYHCDDSFCSTPGGFMCTTNALDVF